MRTRDQERGYSLAELLTVVAMIGVISLVALPALMQLMPQYRIRSAASEVASTLRMARARAISTRTPWMVSFDAANDRYAVSQLTSQFADMTVAANWQRTGENGRAISASGVWWKRPGGIDIRTATANPFNDIDCPSDSVVDVVFLRDGSVSSQPTCSSATALSFSPNPSVLIAFNSNIITFNRYYISVDQGGSVKITPTKE